jgi:hypothetical protein
METQLEQITLSERTDLFLKGELRFKNFKELMGHTRILLTATYEEYGNNSWELIRDIFAQCTEYLSKLEH